ncbi:pyruvate dehydrogenase [Tomitella biformata]|uniref:pyruvate dehydrogenase n=1 Tax=Tomitella biformata TaxID=630403 RepID=UPI0004663ABF|nr:pyruvate dehydrogenase [Tomitella biformata]
MATTVADQLITALVDAGVRRIYGIVGDSLNPVVDAVRRTGGAAKGGIDWIHVRHEEAAAFAASADAQLTGELAVCAGSCGPGNLHLINGLYDAHRAGARVLAIASHIPSTEIGQGYFQETHPDRLFVECSLYTELVSNAAQAPGVFRSAMQAAITGSGVAVVTLPGDVAMAAASGPMLPLSIPAPSVTVPTAATLRTLAAAINTAEKVAIFAGYGVRDAHDEVIALAELIGAPIGHTLRGKDFIQHNNPYEVGMTGLLGYGAAHAGMHDADLLLMLGTDFPYAQFLPKDVRTAQIDLDPTRIGRRTAVEIPVHGDVAATLTALLPLIERKSDRAYVDKWLAKHEKMMNRSIGAYTHDVEKFVPIHPEYAASVLNQVAAEDAVFTTDTGMCNVWTARYLDATSERRFLSSAIHGSMANALPHAMGAQLAYPGRQVISVSGDGGFAMLLSEILTVAMYKIPVKVVLFDNSTLGMVKAEMLVDGLPDFGVDVAPVDYAAIAAAAGIHSQRVERPADIRAALDAAFAVDGPALVHLITDPRALSIPPTVTGEQLKGFALAMSKTVLGGGIGEAVKLARTNLRNIPRP